MKKLFKVLGLVLASLVVMYAVYFLAIFIPGAIDYELSGKRAAGQASWDEYKKSQQELRGPTSH